MKTWIKSLAGFALSAFLAIGLSGRVNASDTDGTDPLPDPSPYEMEDPADPVDSGDTDGLLRTVNIDGEADDADGDDDGSGDNGDYDDDNGDADDEGGNGDDGNGFGAFSLLSANNVEEGPADDGSPVADTEEDPSSDDPSREGEQSQETGILNVVLDENGEETSTFFAVDYNNPDQVLSSDSDITLLAAGLNRLSSIISGGDVSIGGTGILLVDEIRLGVNGVLNFLSNADLYGENGGSVAVFTKEEENTYRCINGSVPGILDEEYTVEGVKLVLPSGCQLLFKCNGSATNTETGEVIYYNESNVVQTNQAIENHDLYTFEETSGCLNIGKDAELVVENGAGITLTDMDSLEEGFVYPVRPVLNVTENGILTVNGEINGGKILVDEYASVSGTGSVNAQLACVASPDCLDDCSVEFSSTLQVDGSGTLDSVILRNGKLFLDSGMTVGNVTSYGSSRLVYSDSVNLNTLSISGTLSISTVQEYGEYTGSAQLGGPISGGTLELSSGMFTFLKKCTLGETDVSVSCDSVIVYDYSDAGLTGSCAGTAPLVMSPKSVTVPDADSHSIPIQIVYMDQLYLFDGGSYYTTSIKDVGSDTYNTSHDGIDLILPSELYTRGEALADEYNETNTFHYSPVVELHFLDGNVLSTAFLDPGEGSFPVDNVYLIRIILISRQQWGTGGGSVSKTSTSFTGSGVLGGANAGSVRYGASTYNLSSSKPVPRTENTDPDNGSDASETESSGASSSSAAETPAAACRVVVSEAAGYSVLEVYNGSEKVRDLRGGKVTVRISSYPLPSDWNSDMIFAVFKNDDGSLTAFQTKYDPATGDLVFDTDRPGEFVLVCLSFDGEPFSPAFYAALEKLPEVQKLLHDAL